MTPAQVRDHGLDAACSRRDVLAQFATGLGGMALATLLTRDAAARPAQRPTCFRIILPRQSVRYKFSCKAV